MEWIYFWVIKLPRFRVAFLKRKFFLLRPSVGLFEVHVQLKDGSWKKVL